MNVKMVDHLISLEHTKCDRSHYIIRVVSYDYFNRYVFYVNKISVLRLALLLLVDLL